MNIVSFIISMISIIATWKLFTKAGEAGWKCLIPIYNLVILFEIVGISPLWVLAYFAFVIPIVGWGVALAVSIDVQIHLAKAFGKGLGFAFGLMLLYPIFSCILAFGSAEYELD
jgi:hypothetical protein